MAETDRALCIGQVLSPVVRFIKNALLPVAALAFVACNDAEQSDAIRVIERVHVLSLPADAAATSYESGDRGAFSLSAQWEFTTTQTWPAYVAWLEHRLAPQFERRHIDASSARFVQQLPGDVYNVTVESEPAARGTRVRVRFVASAFWIVACQVGFAAATGYREAAAW